MDVGNYFISIIDFCYKFLCTCVFTAFGVTFSLFDIMISLIVFYLAVYCIFKIAE